VQSSILNFLDINLPPLTSTVSGKNVEIISEPSSDERVLDDRDGPLEAGVRSMVHILHVLSHLLLIYICKLLWNHPHSAPAVGVLCGFGHPSS
jgi:hypothetical protein